MSTVRPDLASEIMPMSFVPVSRSPMNCVAAGARVIPPGFGENRVFTLCATCGALPCCTVGEIKSEM
jgi:hypothetical protein